MFGGLTGEGLHSRRTSRGWIGALVIASGILGPDPTPEAVQARLEGTAIDAGVAGPDETYGAGRLDAAAATDPAR